MRIYFTHEEKKYSLDLANWSSDSDQISSCTYEFEKKINNIFFKSMATSTFFSLDKVTWHLLHCSQCPDHIILINQLLKVNYGFLPSSTGAESGNSLTSKIPGKVSKIFVAKGQSIKKGDTLLVLEAMKMENEMKSHLDGIIEEILVIEGANVQSGQQLIKIAAL